MQLGGSSEQDEGNGGKRRCNARLFYFLVEFRVLFN